MSFQSRLFYTALLCGIYAIVANASVASFSKRSVPVEDRCPRNKLYGINAEWALNITSQLLGANPDKNVFIAPTSISMALTLLLMGANGETEKEMTQALGYDSLKPRKYLCHLKMWNDMEPNPDLTLGTASRLYLDNSLDIKDRFMDKMKKTKNQSGVAEFKRINFAASPETARKEINSWVSEQTKGHIDELFSSGSFSRETKMAITTAIYFQGIWDQAFDEETYVEPFYTSDDSDPIDAEYMFRAGMELKFLTNRDGIDFIELPYKQVEGGFKISMIAFQANDYVQLNLGEVENKISDVNFMQDSIVELLESQPTTVDVKLPIVTMKEEYDLKEALTSMGMGSMFSPGTANFRGITESPPLYVERAVHKTFFQMNEKGVEAAGATGLQMMPMMMSPSFFATKPFHFIIYDRDTRSILFSGRIYDPSMLI